MKTSGTKDNLIIWLVNQQLKLDKVYDIEVVEHREKKSLAANAYAWVLMDKIAKVLKTTKDEIYLQMLERYGTFVYLPAMVEKVEEIKSLFRITKDWGEAVLTTQNGRKVVCKQLQCYKGISMYDSKEMSDFIDGIISEAQELDIETETPDEIARMKAVYAEILERRKE